METIDVKGHKVIKWQVGASTYLACPQAGARLMNWFITMPDGQFRDILYWPENADMDKIAHVRGGNPILFPFAARTYTKGEIGFWVDPEGEKRPMITHGYARQGHFEVDSIHEKGFLARFVPDAEAQQAYPYRYTFTVSYRFEELALHVDLELHNEEADRLIPWAPGHHFYFNLPWHSGLSREDYRLIAPAKKHLRAQPDGSLTPVKDIPEPISFDDPAAVDLIRAALKTREVRFGPKGGEEDITILIDNKEPPTPWTTLVSWTESPESPFYCVEPWTAPPNAAEHGKGLRWVEPGKRDAFCITIAL